MSDSVPDNIVKRVLLAFNPKQFHAIMVELERGGWSTAAITAADEFSQHDPDWVGCLVLHGADQVRTLALLNWCEQSVKWKYTPKVVLGELGAQFTNVVNVPTAALDKPLIPYLVHSQKTREAAPPNRRNEYRHYCHEAVKITVGSQQYEAMLLDISTGGARLEVNTQEVFAPNQAIELNLSDDPLLMNLQAKVLSTQREAITVIKVRLQYTSLPTAANRALQRFITVRQTRRLKAKEE